MKNFILILLFSCCSLTASAQSGDFYDADVSVYVGANRFFKSGINFVEGDISIKETVSYTVGIKRLLPFQRTGGLSYTFVPTTLSFDPDSRYEADYEGGSADMNIHFITLTGTQYFGEGSVVPFFEAGPGLAIYDVTSAEVDTRLHFLLNFNLGIEFPIADRLGLKLNGGMKLPLFTSSNGVYCGIGTSSGVDCGLSLNSSVIMTHWELGGAVVYNF